ncbi:hypothetical protein YC2023_110716 [Brassica napus]
MRTLCPNFDREDGLETVLEVPMPEELFCSENNKTGAWRSVKSSLLRSPPDNNSSLATLFGGRDAQIQMLLGIKGSSQWSLELVVSGCKVSAGCDGNVAWKQSPWLEHSQASNEPSGPLRRFLQGLDPKTTANMFAGSVCVGEKAVNEEECFVLKLETQPSGLKSRSKRGMETVKHTVWGCFSQRTGLLVQLEDTYLVRIKTGPEEEDVVLWETTSETMIQDYKSVDGIQIAHKGRTRVSLLRLDESLESHSKTTMEESWEIEEVGFNVKGLSSDFFLPPGDLCPKENEESGFSFGDYTSPMMIPLKVSTDSWNLKSSKVTAIEDFGESE